MNQRLIHCGTRQYLLASSTSARLTFRPSTSFKNQTGDSPVLASRLSAGMISLWLSTFSRTSTISQNVEIEFTGTAIATLFSKWSSTLNPTGVRPISGLGYGSNALCRQTATRAQSQIKRRGRWLNVRLPFKPHGHSSAKPMFSEALNSATWSQLTYIYQKLEEPTAKRVSSALVRWLTEDARKKDVPDLADRLANMSARIEKLSRELVIKLDGKVHVSADGDAHVTLVLLDRGSDWFEGHQDVALEIAKAVFNSNEH